MMVNTKGRVPLGPTLVAGALLAAVLACSAAEPAPEVPATMTPWVVEPTQVEPQVEPAEAEPEEEPEEEVDIVPTEERRSATPDDLLPQVSWGGWGAGLDFPECGDGVPSIWIDTADGGGPTPEAPPASEGMLGMVFKVRGCDYAPGEGVEVTFFLPDGSTVRADDLIAEAADVNWSVPWWSLPGDPFGTYTVEVNSASRQLSTSFSVSPPSRPLLLISCGYPQVPAGQAVLTGFQPGEEVLMGAYPEEPAPMDSVGNQGSLADTWYVRIGPDGTGTTSVPTGANHLVVALGQDRNTEIGYSGEAGDEIMLVSAWAFNDAECAPGPYGASGSG